MKPIRVVNKTSDIGCLMSYKNFFACRIESQDSTE